MGVDLFILHYSMYNNIVHFLYFHKLKGNILFGIKIKCGQQFMKEYQKLYFTQTQTHKLWNWKFDVAS